MTKEIKNIIINLFKQGENTKEIARIANCSRATVYSVIKNSRIDTGNKCKRFSKQDIDFLIKNYPTLGANRCAIELNRTLYSISCLVYKLKLKKLPKINELGEKSCAKCKKYKHIDEYYMDSGGIGGRCAYCKTCNDGINKRAILNIKLNDDTRKQYALRKNLSNIKLRAKNNHIDFNLDIDWLMKNTPEYCPVLGIKLSFMGGKNFEYNASSVDRIDSSKGYTKDNCIVVSWRVNRIKNNATIQELEKIAEFYKKFKSL